MFRTQYMKMCIQRLYVADHDAFRRSFGYTRTTGTYHHFG